MSANQPKTAPSVAEPPQALSIAELGRTLDAVSDAIHQHDLAALATPKTGEGRAACYAGMVHRALRSVLPVVTQAAGLDADALGMCRLATASGIAPSNSVGDAELIARCQEFAECELDRWYRNVIATGALANDPNGSPDLATRRWIVATPPATSEGWAAKALALWLASGRDDFGIHGDDQDGLTELLASRLRDLVTPARDAIIASLAVKYGPLPTDQRLDLDAAA